LLLALSINPRHSSYGLLKEGRAFSINVLKKSQLDLAKHYGRPASPDKNLALTESQAEPMTYRETGTMDGASELCPDAFGDS
jgi:flavin reductase (DIM6/NTAB) family NADH-FMN oxidoreductase RutF